MTMKKIFFAFFCLIQFSVIGAEKVSTKRSQCFFGLHFDFHAKSSDTLIGSTLTAQMLDTFLTKVKPDYIQIDCKGHPGISSYPTKVGNCPPKFVQDPYPIFRAATKKQGIPLYSHYSGVYDAEAIKHHPTWARLDKQGQNDKKNSSVFGPYVDSLMIPQIKELIQNYEINGIWVDGDCWSAAPDYSTFAAKAWGDKTGKQILPSKKTDADYAEFMEFNREGFRKYLKHYVDEIHAFKPGFEIASNWAYSSLMPEPVDVAVDFISGDLLPTQSVLSAALESRCIANQGKPWDLMAWGFSLKFDNNPLEIDKTAEMLKQEAAQVLAMGGGFQIYYKQNKDASIKPYIQNVAKELSNFCNERKEFCFRNNSVKQIALLYSTEGFKHKTNSLYNTFEGELQGLKGTLSALLGGQHVVEILLEHQLEKTISQYPMIVIPEWEYISPAFIGLLKNYALQGGKLLIIGDKTVELFKEILTLEILPKTGTERYSLFYDNMMVGVPSFTSFKLTPSAKELGTLYDKDPRFPKSSLIASFSYGKGEVGVIGANLGSAFLERSSFVYKQIINQMVTSLFPDELLKVEASDNLNVHLTTKNKVTYLHLLNNSGSSNNPNVYNYNDIVPIEQIKIQLKSIQPPKSVYLEPGHSKLKFKYKDGVINILVPKLYIYSIVTVE